MSLRAFSKLRILPLSALRLAQGSVSFLHSSTLPVQFSKTVRPTFAALPTRISVRSSSEASSPPELDKALRNRLTELTTRTRVVVLMKGDPMEPRCGFSNAVCRILEAHGVLGKHDPATDAPLLSSFDVLSDSEVREAAKLFSDWPTFPQVFFDGEFIGGCDILLDMHRSGKLAAELERRGIGSLLTEREKGKKN
ncbi:Glutaredoxin-related protein 5, mitochondrial [Echinococcus granulosus]|uniref:Glutaredoxin protein 5 n=1 Tax=Echinococcus granulosus TaxID=6210 RepID=U6J1A3_ECHGR|nr:Glutaredoxin-related protein 5 [Echinococcus granulosus]EUB62482.1 Glutaredoxin-related protein 5 [Echinococcus granulosus]KAH9283031.1 Glutaredoxin-related protein 5, mitochondrial [Echinococcus granulosus]CDS17070.1 Glutaredoxin protein 5 [Echinococcus granulosus]